jgi:hypothetical protein
VKPKKAKASSPTVIMAMGIPAKELGILAMGNRSRILVSSSNARVKPEAEAKEKINISKNPNSF